MKILLIVMITNTRIQIYIHERAIIILHSWNFFCPLHAVFLSTVVQRGKTTEENKLAENGKTIRIKIKRVKEGDVENIFEIFAF